MKEQLVHQQVINQRSQSKHKHKFRYENKEVSIKLSLNDAMNIGTTYPQPAYSNETNPSMKEYE